MLKITKKQNTVSTTNIRRHNMH